jgi:hypothetical protein
MYIAYTLLSYVHTCIYQVYSSTWLLMPLKPGQVCTNCLTLLIPVMRLWRYSFSAWIEILRLASPAFQSQSCLHCSRKRSIFLTSCRKTSLIRPGKKPSGILKRHTAFCTRYAKLCCGETRITRHVKHQRLVNMYVHVFTLYIMCTYK